MTTKRASSWFLTERGRRFSFAVVTGTGIALTAARFVPNTLLLSKYKDIVHYYSNGKPVELPEQICEIYQKCLDVLKISDVHRKLISPFSIYGYDLFHAGCTNSKFGVIVGVPVNFFYKTVDDVKKDDILVNQKKIDWNSEVGMKLAEALVLPEKVQKFAICREILMAHNNKIVYESTYPFACIFFAYNLATYINRRLNLYKAPLTMRGALYALVGMFSTGLYFLMKDMTEVYYETETDKKLCELGPDFIESGVILYDKLLQRNQALRILMGNEGLSKYSAHGNENFGLRQPRLALVHRKRYFEERLKEITEEEQSETFVAE